MTMFVEVSVVMPIFNDEPTLARAIESILKQTFENFELILVDNNSSDNSYAIATEYEARYENVRLVEEPRQGIGYALNTGIEAARGEYIARMDADDISLPNRLEKQVTVLKTQPEIGVVASCANHISTAENQDGLSEYVAWSNKLLSHEEIALNRFIESPVIHPTVMFHKDLIERYGGFVHGGFPEDYDLWLRWLKHGVKFHKLNDKLLDWIDLPNRLTRTDSRYTDQAFYETKSVYLYEWLKENNPFFPDVVVWGAGRISRQRFTILNELGIRPRFFIDINPNPKRNVIEYKDTPLPGKIFILSYVGSRGARERIKQFLFELGYTEGKDFLCIS